MSLDAFKTIYWWEWTHRLLARSTGVGVPAAVSVISSGAAGSRRSLRARLWAIFGGGALLGAVGWWMVASGLAGSAASACRNIGWRFI